MNTSLRFTRQQNSFEMVSSPIFETEVQQRMALVEWINTMIPNLSMSVKASEAELRASLLNGDILCNILQRLRYNTFDEGDDSISRPSPEKRRRKIQRFIAVVSEMGLPTFELSDLETGSMKPVLDCLIALKEHSTAYYAGSPLKPEDRRRNLSVVDSKYQRAPNSPESPTMVLRKGTRFHDVFQMKQGLYSDLSSTKISELMKSNSLDNAPTQSLLSVMNGILDEAIERKDGEIPQRVACLLRKVVQELERRIATQAEHLKTQNNLFKVREEKFNSRIRVLEALAKGTSEETEIVRNQLQHFKNSEPRETSTINKQKDDELSTLKQELEIAKRKLEHQDASLLKRHVDGGNSEILALKEELKMEKKKLEQQEDYLLKKHKDETNSEILALKEELKIAKKKLEQQDDYILKKPKDEVNSEISALKEELRTAKKKLEQQDAEGNSEISALQEELKMAKKKLEQKDDYLLKKPKDEVNSEISALKEELKTAKKKLEQQNAEGNSEISALQEELKMAKKKLEQLDSANVKKPTNEDNPELLALKKDLEMAKKKAEQEASMLKKQKDESNVEFSTLKQELEVAKKKAEQEASMLKKEKDESNVEISTLKQELEVAKKKAEREASMLKKEKDESNVEISTLKQELELAKKKAEQEASMLKKEKDESNVEISTLKQELEVAKKTHELRYLELETEAKVVKSDLEKRLRQQEQLLEDSKVTMKELEANSLSKIQIWAKKEEVYGSFMDIQWTGLEELRHSSEGIKREMLMTQKTYLSDINQIGMKLKKLASAAESYHEVLNENRKLYNELQDLKGNIRVYCRIRPFRPHENSEETIVDSIGEHGELTVANPSKPKDPPKLFRFNKVYGSMSTQAEVFADTQPLVRTILDGYNVCIFAYGQTGSGKTYTMSGPDNASKEDWGVNYRALDDLFQISEDRKDAFTYEIGVQMIEIYNEQIRDLGNDGPQKKLGIVNTPQSNGLAVPDASMHPVTSTEDVIELMNIGLANRSVTSTAMNERSSRSHSVVTIHVQGKDLQSGTSSHGSLHLVDLAGSERIDRSEVTGDALREAQHINKSLAALGDVIFALAQKNPHVPYRNSKLTQVLQSSLGGRAKTLMFVQVNPDVTSFSESLSTLKFAERVSGVELGAAKSSKDGRDPRDLIDQVGTLKDSIAKKDEEIERLQVVKEPKSPRAGLKNSLSSLRSGTGSPTARSMGGSPKRGGLMNKEVDNSDHDSEGGLRLSRSLSDLKTRNSPRHSNKGSMDEDETGTGDADSELSVGTDDVNREASSGTTPEKVVAKPNTPTRASQQSRLASQTGTPSRLSQVRTTLRTASALKKPASGNSSPVAPGSAGSTRKRGGFT